MECSHGVENDKKRFVKIIGKMSERIIDLEILTIVLKDMSNYS